MDNSYSNSGHEIDIYSDLEKILPELIDSSYLTRASRSLKDLLEYPFESKEFDGSADQRYNEAERVDIVRDNQSRIVRCPVRFLKVLQYIEKMRGGSPSIGLRYKNGSVINYIHFLFEEREEGWIYHDSQRSLQVTQVHKYEKILDHTGLKKVAIIANKIGVPAKNEVSRINSERGNILTLHYYDTINNRSLNDFF